MADYLAKKSAYDGRVKETESKRDALANERSCLERKILTLQSEIKIHERDVAEVSDTCPTCGQKLPPEKIAELESKRNAARAEIDSLEKQVSEVNSRMTEINGEITSLTQDIVELAFEEPQKPKTRVFDASILNETIKEMDGINISKVRSDLETAKTALVRIEGINAQLKDKQKILLNAEKELAALSSSADAGAEQELADAQEKLDGLSARYTQVKSEIASLETTIEAAKKNIAEIDGQKAELDRAIKEVEAASLECTEWELVSKAFGKDGIQALELDALAPGISETANNLLHSAYGERFSISIETTRIGGAGKKAKQIEDFKIMVSDNGETTTLENKSGGEAVWIKRAIYDAFAVIRRRNTGFAFLTCFQDETDGALDAGAKTAYCRMLEASHEAAKLRHTIIITHSNEVKAMVEQKIAMESL